MNNYKIGGLFSGVGGIEYGFEKAGFKVAWSNEIDKHANPNLYHRVFTNAVRYHEAITKFLKKG